jgi:hypothetical protein
LILRKFVFFTPFSDEYGRGYEKKRKPDPSLVSPIPAAHSSSSKDPYTLSPGHVQRMQEEQQQRQQQQLLLQKQQADHALKLEKERAKEREKQRIKEELRQKELEFQREKQRLKEFERQKEVEREKERERERRREEERRQREKELQEKRERKLLEEEQRREEEQALKLLVNSQSYISPSHAVEDLRKSPRVPEFRPSTPEIEVISLDSRRQQQERHDEKTSPVSLPINYGRVSSNSEWLFGSETGVNPGIRS